MEDEKDIEVVLDEQKAPEPQKTEEPVIVVEGEEHPQVEAQDDPSDALKKMEKKLKKAKEKTEKLERERERAEQDAHLARQEAGENRKHVMMAALNQVKMDTERLMSQYAEAMSINNFDEAAKIQAQMSQNAVRSAQFEAEIESLKRQDQQQGGSQLDQIIKSVSPESARWLKQNREHLDSDKAIRKMFRAHEDAVEDGIKPDSDDYFEFIEKRLGISNDADEDEAPKKRKKENRSDDEPMSAAAKPSQKAPPPPAAPVERYGARPNVVRLSRAEAETAKMLGMTEKEYATHKIALQKEGKLSS